MDQNDLKIMILRETYTGMMQRFPKEQKMQIKTNKIQNDLREMQPAIGHVAARGSISQRQNIRKPRNPKRCYSLSFKKNTKFFPPQK